MALLGSSCLTAQFERPLRAALPFRTLSTSSFTCVRSAPMAEQIQGPFRIPLREIVVALPIHGNTT